MEQLFASFILDRTAALEIALRADIVTETAPVSGSIQSIPSSIDFVEGMMHLRNDAIPVVNLKKRLGLKESGYGAGAKVAVINLYDTRYGLLFDDIKEVFRVESAKVRPVDAVLQSEDKIISSLITLDNGKRVVEVLDPLCLFGGGSNEAETVSRRETAAESRPVDSSRFVVFECAGQEYGVPVHCSQEITFYSNINEIFQSGSIEGAVKLRGHTIPVINSAYLLNGNGRGTTEVTENTRILVLASEECSLGLVVERIKEIITVREDKILPMPPGSNNVSGVYPRKGGGNIMLLDIQNLVCAHIDKIKSLARINHNKEENGDSFKKSHTHHLITENCYLIFRIERNYAIKIGDVSEIIESDGVMGIPGAAGFNTQVINLRGQMVPVVNLRSFYNYPPKATDSEKSKLIICKGDSCVVALEVDRIVTIFKQEEFHVTPSLNPQLAGRRDTLDRLIDFIGPEEISEHVLVVNVDNLVRNHLQHFAEQSKQCTVNDEESKYAHERGEENGI